MRGKEALRSSVIGQSYMAIRRSTTPPLLDVMLHTKILHIMHNEIALERERIDHCEQEEGLNAPISLHGNVPLPLIFCRFCFQIGEDPSLFPKPPNRSCVLHCSTVMTRWY